MLNFNAYNGRDLQQFLSILNQCEAKGVTDIRFVRQRIQENVTKRLKAYRPKKMTRILRKSSGAPLVKQCPSCKTGILLPVGNDDELKIRGCRNCYYSELVK